MRYGIIFAMFGVCGSCWKESSSQDVDLVAMSEHVDVLAKNGEVMRKHRFDPTCTFELCHKGGLQIDICRDEHSDGIAQRAREVELAGRKIRIAEAHDLIAMKLRADRLQDGYSISQIVKHTRIDDRRIRDRVSGEDTRGTC